MNKAHRDRIAFMRICSGKFTAGMEVTHVQGGNKKIKLSQPQQMMAQERHIVDEAYAGDIIGVFDPVAPAQAKVRYSSCCWDFMSQRRAAC